MFITLKANYSGKTLPQAQSRSVQGLYLFHLWYLHIMHNSSFYLDYRLCFSTYLNVEVLMSKCYI